MARKDARSALIKIGSQHTGLAKYFDPQGKNSLLFVSDPIMVDFGEGWKESSFREDVLLNVLTSLIDADYDIDSADLAYSIVKSFDAAELREIESELENSMSTARKFNQESYLELSWHLNEILRDRLSSKGMSKLIPKWKYI